MAAAANRVFFDQETLLRACTGLESCKGLLLEHLDIDRPMSPYG
ncbi:MAG: hypothetical protein QOH67_4618, partial [Hyphomicrobiales bacterium]|nr:hypothetical protein [Hyphomicrobiales bacterium]